MQNKEKSVKQMNCLFFEKCGSVSVCKNTCEPQKFEKNEEVTVLRTSGFTLIETLIAMVIAATVLIGAATLVQSYVKDTAYLNKKLAADLAAKNLLDRFLTPWADNLKYRPATVETGTVEQGPYTFAYSQTLQNTSTTGLREVTLVIYDEGRETPIRTLTMFADTQ